MSRLSLQIGSHSFAAVLETDLAPLTCAAFLARLPFEGQLVQARWSGGSGWIPLGDYDLDVPSENSTSHPAPGQVLWHPPGISEAELLLPYGQTIFSSKFGQLEGNHFLTILDEQNQLAEVGRKLMWEGAQRIAFSAAPL